ncbi:hypothetical protein [Microbulbifer zhoushanensis]|uniref:hypothetical protein n=1 Tax=Microbulbifer zhoushanensis TaxID=2904254 RepID=UPI001F284E99|nr:hypothetical protein [Microbulbifer zhoushanensis]
MQVKQVDTKECISKNYDFCIFSLGYESRCTNLPKLMAKNPSKKISYRFSHSQVLSYKSNEDWYNSNDIEILSIPHDEIENHIFRTFAKKKSKEFSVLLDISSFDRAYIASFLQAFYQLSKEETISINVNICYSIANYTPPVEDGPVIKAGPVIPEFAGWPRDPALPTECFIGLGYEEGKALGALEYIEPKSTWLIKPNGIDKRFDQSVELANKTLYDYSSKTRVIGYNLTRPYATFIEIESLVSSFIDDSRPIFVPFGPKIFFAISALIALRNYPYVSVWRVSSGVNAEPVDREAAGQVCCLSVVFQNQ